jgi:RimJ/RimL family protein N-acetyltransferase
MTTQKRIQLRIKRLSDARDDYSWQTDPELAKLDASETLDMTYRQYLSEYTCELCYPSPSRHEFAIETLEGKHIGNCVYYNVNEKEGKAEIGILIGDRDYWNRGYGTETIKLLLEHIFIKTLLERVYLTTLDWNIRAQQCFIKCGFNDSGKLIKDNYSFLLMTLHRAEWQALQIKNEQPPEAALKSNPLLPFRGGRSPT